MHRLDKREVKGIVVQLKTKNTLAPGGKITNYNWYMKLGRSAEDSGE